MATGFPPSWAVSMGTTAGMSFSFPYCLSHEESHESIAKGGYEPRENCFVRLASKERSHMVLCSVTQPKHPSDSNFEKLLSKIVV
jgi:hypothetical protein